VGGFAMTGSYCFCQAILNLQSGHSTFLSLVIVPHSAGKQGFSKQGVLSVQLAFLCNLWQ
jgi:hypothetical protein